MMSEKVLVPYIHAWRQIPEAAAILGHWWDTWEACRDAEAFP